MTLIPSLRKISSNEAVNLLSRSWIRNRIRSNTPLKLRLRACWVTPGAGRVGRTARQQDVQATERDRLDGEEIAREHARGLLAEEVSPARTLTPRRGLEVSCEQQPSHGARRDTAAELQ